jgi:hypothetical protein
MSSLRIESTTIVVNSPHHLAESTVYTEVTARFEKTGHDDVVAVNVISDKFIVSWCINVFFVRTNEQDAFTSHRRSLSDGPSRV